MPALEALRSLGAGLSRITERWVPDSWVICMGLTAVVLALAVGGAGAGVEEAVVAWGDGVWTLLSLGMQFAISLVAAYACVTSRPAFRLLDRLAAIPDPDRPRQAIALIGLFSMAAGYLNAAVCTVACALFVPFVARRNPNTDIRVIIAGAYLGLGTVWHGGLSGSAPLILATPGNPLLEPGTGAPIVDRLYPVTETLFLPFNLVYLLVIGSAALGTLLLLHPSRDVRTLTAEQAEAILPKLPPDEPVDDTPAGRVDAFRGWVWLAVVLLAYPLGHSLVTKGFGATWTINAYNTVFLTLALLLHGRPLPFLRACRQGVDTAWGLILQFPFYAGIFGVMQNAGLGAWLGGLFERIATTAGYPLLVYLYSGVMNLFVPSGGSKWLIEAPYLIPAGEEMGVSVITVMLAYAYGDSTTNLIQPLWAIPVLAVTRMRFGDIVGYTFLVALACLAVNIVAMLVIPAAL
ncbi:MAG: short-chain fatty acid transporter [Myxococcales bacterium]|nr:short-chain fatty acid transporter [Myxococcales bacterium]